MGDITFSRELTQKEESELLEEQARDNLFLKSSTNEQLQQTFNIIANKICSSYLNLSQIELEFGRRELNKIFEERMIKYDMTREEVMKWSIDKGTPEEFKAKFRKEAIGKNEKAV